jgi:hypothetical protein
MTVTGRSPSLDLTLGSFHARGNSYLTSPVTRPGRCKNYPEKERL